jgi:hypothetical protein
MSCRLRDKLDGSSWLIGSGERTSNYDQLSRVRRVKRDPESVILSERAGSVNGLRVSLAISMAASPRIPWTCLGLFVNFG